MDRKLIVLGIESTAVGADEAALLRAARPWGVILFRRNIADPAQLAGLTAALRDIAGHDLHILIDQEGGRVARLRAPHWRVMPRPGAFTALWQTAPERAWRACWLNYRLCAHDLAALGIDIDLAPVLDVSRDWTHWSHGDVRTFGRDPAVVAQLGRAAAEALMAGGVLPVVKHMPGHGGAGEDSHEVLPTVKLDEATLDAIDFAPFRALNDLPAGMVVHVAFPAVEPGFLPSTFSVRVIQGVIRERIGFDGVLFSDDLFMNALDGDYEQRIARALAAGCEIPLFCHGDVRARERAVAATPEPSQATGGRINRAFAQVGRAVAAALPFDAAEASEELRSLLAGQWSPDQENWPEQGFVPAIGING